MNARDEILSSLKKAPKKASSPPAVRCPPYKTLSMTREELIGEFTRILVEETGVVHRVKDDRAALDKLGERSPRRKDGRRSWLQPMT